MRRVVIPDKATPPADWLDEAAAVTVSLRKATNDDERKTIIEKSEKLWRDDRVRNWLLQRFNNKCWYTEAQDSVSAIHVDHYRPKGRVSDLDKKESDGYWWLAFDWTNYRMCGQLINVKKSDVFPFSEPQRAASDDPASLKLEAPLLIDPTTDDAKLISYEVDEDGCRAVPQEGILLSDLARAKATIDILGLNRLDRLNQKRRDMWNLSAEKVGEYVSAATDPQCMRMLRQAGVVADLKRLIAYEAEFSSIADACIEKVAPPILRAKVRG